MGNLVKYGSFNLDDLDKQDAQVAATTTVGADFMKLQPGNNKVRFIPPEGGGSPFEIVNEHFIDTPTGQRVRFTCPRLMEKKDCPACQEADRLKRTGNPITALAEGDDGITKVISDQWDLSKYSSVPSLEEAMNMMREGYQKTSQGGGAPAPAPRQIEAPSRSARKASDDIYDVGGGSDDVLY